METDGPSSLLATAPIIGPQQVQGSEESVCTIMNQGGSGTNTVTTTPRKTEKEELNLKVDEPGERNTITDINANPTLATSTPQSEKVGGEMTRRDLDSVSPLSEMANAEGLPLNMATSSVSGCSSQSGSIQLSQLYQDICDQKDVIMSCLEEDNCDIDQVTISCHNSIYSFLLPAKCRDS